MRLDLTRHFPAMGRVSQRAASWWSARSRREQGLLAILALLVLLWFGLTVVARPLLAARSDALNRIRMYQDLSERLRRSGPIGPVRANQRSGAPATILSTSAVELGLAPTVTQGDGRYRVTMTDAPYDVLMRWIVDVEKSSTLRFVSMRLERRPTSGLVSADLVVRP